MTATRIDEFFFRRTESAGESVMVTISVAGTIRNLSGSGRWDATSACSADSSPTRTSRTSGLAARTR